MYRRKRGKEIEIKIRYQFTNKKFQREGGCTICSNLFSVLHFTRKSIEDSTENFLVHTENFLVITVLLTVLRDEVYYLFTLLTRFLVVV